MKRRMLDRLKKSLRLKKNSKVGLLIDSVRDGISEPEITRFRR